MKITAPPNPDEYFRQTADFVRHAYAGLEAGWRYYQQALPRWDVMQLGGQLTAEQKEAVDRYLERAEWYFGQKLSEAMHAGAVLQTASMAIRLYSRNTAVPARCAAIVPAGHPAAAYCIGQERHGMPSGLIVYAGRNQYNHWDEGDPHPVTANVFHALTESSRDNVFADLAFALSNPGINIYASEILLTALGWRSYATYLYEMESMLG